MAIERARELNRLACENISHGEIESACEKLLDAIRNSTPTGLHRIPIWGFYIVGKESWMNLSLYIKKR